MRLLFSFFFLFSLAVPVSPVRAAAPVASEMCARCGHKCCCPEMCAPKKQPVAPRMSCDRMPMSCQIQSAPTTGAMNLKKDSSVPSPKNVTFGHIARNPNPFAGVLAYAVLPAASTPFEIPTPPPRQILA